MAADRIRFHQRVYRFLSPVVRAWIGRRFSMTYPEVPELPDHFLLISNHVTNYDMFIVGLTLRAHMYFVSTEHIFRLGLISRIIRFLTDPIPIAKGGSTSGAVLEILRRLKAGCSVCLFAEGNCSWDGRTIAFPDATGKMVQKSKAPLVTVRIKGGYFSHPRWAYTHRRGPLRCEVVGIHQPEELAGMKPAEINRLIADEIGEDAYAAQLADPKPYVGKALSRGLERTFLACPKCGRLASIRSTVFPVTAALRAAMTSTECCPAKVLTSGPSATGKTGNEASLPPCRIRVKKKRFTLRIRAWSFMPSAATG